MLYSSRRGKRIRLIRFPFNSSIPVSRLYVTVGDVVAREYEPDRRELNGKEERVNASLRVVGRGSNMEWCLRQPIRKGSLQVDGSGVSQTPLASLKKAGRQVGILIRSEAAKRMNQARRKRFEFDKLFYFIWYLTWCFDFEHHLLLLRALGVIP